MGWQLGFRRSLVGLACVGALVATSLAAPVAAQDPVTFRVGITQAPVLKNLNPFQSTTGIAYTFLSDRYDLLVEFGEGLAPVPGLAESWHVSDDGLVWTYTMREGVKWQDGQPFTAEDARFTLQYIFDSHDPDYKGPLAPGGNANKKGRPKHPLSIFDSYLDLTDGLDDSAITSIEAPDERTLVIETKEPLVTLEAMYIPILPKHIWKDITFEQAQGAIAIEQAIGTGPYRVTQFEPKQVVVLEKFEDHWGGTPQVDRLVYQYFDNDEAMVASLVSGEVDLLTDVPPGLHSVLDGAAGITLNVAPISDFAELGFNSWNPTPERFEDEGCEDCPMGPTNGSLGDPWLTMPEVRAALAGLLDKQQLVDFALSGFGTPGVGIISSGSALNPFVPDPDDPAAFPPYEGDGERDAARATANARFLAQMDALGFVDTDGNGILNVPDSDEARAFDPDGAGQDWSLRLFVREDDEEDKLAGQLIEQWYELAGVDVAYEEVSEDPRLFEVTIPASSNADMDLFIWGWEPDVEPDAQLSYLTCGAINSWQDANYCDPEYDALYEQQHVTLDREARAEIIGQMVGKQFSDAPYAVLWNYALIEGYRSDEWQGLRPMTEPTGVLWSAFGFGPHGSRLTVAPVDGA